MLKTTVYLPEDTKRALSRLAEVQGRSEAELIRRAVEGLLEAEQGTLPKMPLFASGQPDLAHRVDEALAGFGE